LRFYKASRSDAITNKILKWGLDWLENTLLNILNKWWAANCYPASWNEILLCPVLKSGSVIDQITTEALLE
jgi:hypothetical protein